MDNEQERIEMEQPAEETVTAASATKEEDEKERKKLPLWLWIVIAAVVIAAAVVLMMLLKPKASEPEPVVSEASTVPTTTTTTTKPIVRVENPIDFAELKKQNEDIVAWVSVPNTNVDYAVAQSSEDEEEDFYLHRNLDKEYEFAGTVYIQKLNNKDFTDPHTILYGHAMLNGTMFKTLHYFQEKEFFDDNPTFTIYIPEHILTYKIFAAYQYDDRHLLYSFNTKDPKEFENYLNYAQHPTADMQNTRPLPLKSDSRIVTLSTCLKANAPIRYLVQGVLVKDEWTY